MSGQGLARGVDVVLRFVRRLVPEPLRRRVRRLYLESFYYRLFPEEVPRLGIPYDRHPTAPFRVAGTRGSSPTILCLPIIDWYFRYQRPQHVLVRLAARGHSVLYLDPNLDGALCKPAKDLLDRWTLPIADRMTQIKLPTVLRGDRSDLAGKTGAVIDALRPLLLALGTGDVTLLVHQPAWAPLVEPLARWLGATVVYDCMDEHASFPGAPAHLVADETALVGAADLVLASSAKLLEKHEASARRAVLVPNACDFEHFSRAAPVPEDLASRPRPLVGYVGAISEWFAPELVTAAARARPEATFVIVGGASPAHRAALEGEKNVLLLGEKDYTELPGYLNAFDVCLIPFRRNPLTLATSPVKLFEYLSAGKPVVSVRLPEVAAFAEHVHFGDEPAEFVRALDAALADRRPEDARRRVARENGWDARVAVLAGALRETAPRGSIVIVSDDEWERTKFLLDAVFAFTPSPPAEVIVVDRWAKPDVRTGLYTYACQRPLKTVFASAGSWGAAAALGVAAASAENVVLLRAGALVTPGWLRAIARGMESSPVVAVPAKGRLAPTALRDLASLAAARRDRSRSPGAARPGAPILALAAAKSVLSGLAAESPEALRQELERSGHRVGDGEGAYVFELAS
jgi:glycosyltransferase involved in cell wall biosynthesis